MFTRKRKRKTGREYNVKKGGKKAKENTRFQN